MTGNSDFDPDSALFLLDESLTPAVATALAAVGYNIITVLEAFGRQEVQDPEIIAWCQARQAVWIHADDKAKKQHQALLQTSGIRTIWVYRHGGQMTGKEQLRILSSAFPKLPDIWSRRRASRHVRVTAAKPVSAPSVQPQNL